MGTENLNLQAGRYMPSADPALRISQIEAYLAKVSQELEYLQAQLQNRLQRQEDRLAALEACLTAGNDTASS